MDDAIIYLCLICMAGMGVGQFYEKYSPKSYGFCELCWSRDQCAPIPTPQYKLWTDSSIAGTTDDPLVEDNLEPEIETGMYQTDPITLPTEGEDPDIFFQHISTDTDQTFSTILDSHPLFTTYIIVKNRRNHVVDLTESWLIGCGKMGLNDLEAEGEDVLDTIKVYELSTDDDPDSNCYVEVHADLILK